MICINTYFRFNRILLLSIGLWPYKRTKLVEFQAILILAFLIFCITYLFATFAFTKCTPALVINVLSIALLGIIYAFSYHSFYVNVHTIRWLMYKLQHIYNDLKDENEIAIVTKYGNIAKRFTAIMMLFEVCCVITILLLTFLLQFLDTTLLVDKSESRYVMQKVIPKYFIGRESFLYLIIPSLFASASIGGTAVVATGMMFVTYLKHTCGMFRIASYRIEKAMMIKMLKNVNLENEIIIYKEIVHAVDIHRKAVHFAMLVYSTFKGLLCTVTVVGVICLSCNLYRLSETMSRDGEIEQCYMHLLITITIFIILFISNSAGQEVTDYNNHVFLTAYKVQWYVAPLHIQRLILFILQNGSKTFRPSIIGLFSFSIEIFASLTKASLSYFTVIYSMQQ
ncbi:PREDICTED: uncharacterized protein LOC105560062 isoform X2 [Vollenhovia emeryi]|uniref:uncharacterized protein LOC105560062 isoform X2 n=1 Tax=Vollenhovia emeryi TaxID=411798 RepID=UPI0005F5000C|nr:PREDICTED: uncharacterized protein LOC105560062 isoform X2 [Vollenhovia emeryi]XP_011864206.1 PREDICTED: uncharacterized protein LOC105560062 isoform X2 [Vollenhovia emeryi]